MRAAEDEGGPGRAGRVVEGRGTGAGIQPTCTPGTRRPQDRVGSAEHLRPQPLPSCSVLDPGPSPGSTSGQRGESGPPPWRGWCEL